MEQSIEESLLQAIKNDDEKSFGALMDRTQCGSYRLGRFPTLSLMYLYKSRKLLAVYEKKFLTISEYKILREPMEVAGKFSAEAGKCLRLYFNEVVSPVEMLLILDRTNYLKRVFPQTNPSSMIKGRLKSIYYIKYSLRVQFEGDNIIIERRPLTYREKKRIASICVCLILVVTLIIGAPICVVTLTPKPIEGEAFKLKHIDFASQNEYVLKKDIVVPKNYSVEKVKCVIIGEGHKLIFRKGATLGELSGKISDLTIESVGDTLFTSISASGKLENVTVNVNADVEASQSGAFVTAVNYGTIENVALNVKGKLKAISPSEGISELTFGSVAQNNGARYDSESQTVQSGIISKCKVNYSNFSLVGEAGANAQFGGVAGVNSAYLQECSTSGEITADTFDVAGVCALNNGRLYGNVNEASLSQTSADTGWNPIVSGIVLTNAYAVEKCENKGKISSVSNCGEFEIQPEYEHIVSASGIAYLNRSSSARSPYIINSANLGDVESKAERRSAYASGVCLSSSGSIENCKNAGAVSAEAGEGMDAYVGGIAAIASSVIYKSVNEGAVSARGGASAYAGGIAAQTVTLISNCISSSDISVAAKMVYAGGILGYSEVAAYGSRIYFGVADCCISKNKISVARVEGVAAYVGGVVGCVREEEFGETYYGGCVTNCYFIGESASDVSYFGNIVGVCGANIYQSNSYSSSDGTVYSNFEGNRYLQNSRSAFGAAQTGEDNFAAVSDKGAVASTLEDIVNSQAYKSISDSNN